MYRVMSSGSYASYESHQDHTTTSSGRLDASKFGSLLDQAEEESEVLYYSNSSPGNQDQDDNQDETEDESVQSRSQLSLYLEETKRRHQQKMTADSSISTGIHSASTIADSASSSEDTHSSNSNSDSDDLSTCAHPGVEAFQPSHQHHQNPHSQETQNFCDESRDMQTREQTDPFPATPLSTPNQLVPVCTNNTQSTDTTESCTSSSNTPQEYYYYHHRHHHYQETPPHTRQLAPDQDYEDQYDHTEYLAYPTFQEQETPLDNQSYQEHDWPDQHQAELCYHSDADEGSYAYAPADDCHEDYQETPFDEAPSVAPSHQSVASPCHDSVACSSHSAEIADEESATEEHDPVARELFPQHDYENQAEESEGEANVEPDQETDSPCIHSSDDTTPAECDSIYCQTNNDDDENDDEEEEDGAATAVDHPSTETSSVTSTPTTDDHNSDSPAHSSDHEEVDHPPPLPPQVQRCHTPDPSDLTMEHDQSWWEEWDEEIQRQMPSINALASLSADGQDMMNLTQLQHYLEGVAGEDPILQGIAVAFYKGLTLQQERHDAKIQDLQEQHKQQLAMLRQQHQPSNNNNTTSPSSPTRTEALRRRWRSKTSRSVDFTRPAPLVGDNDRDHDTFTVATVLSTMSCRELSMERYRARILRQMNAGLEADAVTKTQQQPPPESNKEAPQQNSEEIQRLLDDLQQAERRQKKLEQQLKQAGVVLAEDIPYQEAKDQVARISKRMNEIGDSGVEHDDPVMQKSLREEYYRLEKDMERYIAALMLTDEFMQEQQQAEDDWEASQVQENQHALQQIRRHMPVMVRMMARKQLEEEGIPPAMIKKFQRTNVLLLLRRDPKAIARWHPSNLESLRVSGMTLTERRALHHHLLPAVAIWTGRQGASSSDALNERKLTWWQTMRSNLKESLVRYERHVQEADDGVAGHRCNLIGKQCPVRANEAMDYSGDLGFPADDVYEESTPVAKAETTDGSNSDPAQSSSTKDDKIAKDRLEQLREHYKSDPKRIQQVSRALQVCEAMDTAMARIDTQLEEWIIKQLQPSQTDSSEGQVDGALEFLAELRSSLSSWLLRDSVCIVEIGLSEELGKAARDYLGGARENILCGELSPDHVRLKHLALLVEKQLHELHLRNDVFVSSSPGASLPLETRERKSRTEIMAELRRREGSGQNGGKVSNCNRTSLPSPGPIAKDSTPRRKPTNHASKPKKGPAPNALLAAISARRGAN
ncbi:expressed unknown protein [Seminavis robusta]|uniref:Uncharacterized protein n=1 Tax=Seminavis robusta TaxID=568900 RepID=A0A9N8DWB8_9STRA|nr:expressed unknown protein [Seminavis robusta]|eukprot:Sro401_g135240.1 n/a (1223) ;mRNA; f:2031-5699